MTDKPNFILVPDPDPDVPRSGGTFVTLFDRVRALVSSVTAALPYHPAALTATEQAARSSADVPTRPRLVFGFDATASREPAWATARQATDALVRALPGQLDVALAVHGGSRLHTVTAFTADSNTLRDRAAGITCMAGSTRMLPILSRALTWPGVRVVTYIGDVFEESPARGRKHAVEVGGRGMPLLVLHDLEPWTART